MDGICGQHRLRGSHRAGGRGLSPPKTLFTSTMWSDERHGHKGQAQKQPLTFICRSDQQAGSGSYVCRTGVGNEQSVTRGSEEAGPAKETAVLIVWD